MQRSCRNCGELRPHVAHGLCSACYQRDPAQVGVWLAGAEGRLGARGPAWLPDLAAWLMERCAPAVCLRHLRRVERAIAGGQERPVALLEALTDRGRSGRSPGATARLVEAFLVDRGLTIRSDEAGRLAAGRRARRIVRCPQPFRAGAERYLAAMLESNERARRRGERALADNTVERRIATLARFSSMLAELEVQDWSAVSRSHVEAFVGRRRDGGSQLGTLRAFFRFARRERLCLTDPTDGIRHREAPGFRGRVLGNVEQAKLLRRWSGQGCHPHEALIGLLALLHGASQRELRDVKRSDVGAGMNTLRLGRRSAPVPLDPLNARALDRCLRHREALGTENPHLIVTRQTRGRVMPASAPYLSHVLDPAGVSPRLLRQTRLTDLTHRLDPRLVADAFGITAEAALHYLVGAVDSEAHVFANL
jgi:site-specific recombinase XerD